MFDIVNPKHFKVHLGFTRVHFLPRIYRKIIVGAILYKCKNFSGTADKAAEVANLRCLIFPPEKLWVSE